MMRKFSILFLLTMVNVSTLNGECSTKFGGAFGNLRVTELGNFFDDVSRFTDDDITDIKFEPSIPSDISEHFTVSKQDTEWVLEVKPSLTEWYDIEKGWGEFPNEFLTLPITYTCGADTATQQHSLWILGDNNRPPKFEKSSYAAEISKTLPPGVPLDYVLDIQATDNDYICADDPSKEMCFLSQSNPSYSSDPSNNVASCSVEPSDIILCEAKAVDSSPGTYALSLSLIKSIEDLPGKTYPFKIKATDQGSTPKTSEVDVTLTFTDQDLLPPVFTNGGIYLASKLGSSFDMGSVSEDRPVTIDVSISASDGDDDTTEDVTLSVDTAFGTCGDCFRMTTDNKLQLVKPLDETMIRDRLVTVMIMATEQTNIGRSTKAVVNIPIVGDDHNPLLDSEFYSNNLDEDGSLGQVTSMTVTDEDTLLPQGPYTFKLTSDTSFFDVDQFFQLSSEQTTATLAPKDGIDITKLPLEGIVSFFIEVAEDKDTKKKSRSMITVTYETPSSTSSSTSPTSPTDNPCDCETMCPISSTISPSTAFPTEPSTCPTCPDTTPETSECPVCSTTAEPITTPRPDNTDGDELFFTSGDHGLDNIQNVGYPNFIPLENAVKMPITSVTAECTNSSYNSFMEYSLTNNDQEKFYIGKTSGDIFLVNNAGYQTLGEACPQSCSLIVSAELSNLAVDIIDIEVTISGVGSEQVLIFDSDEDYTEAEQVVNTINDETEDDDVWFRILNVQPKETVEGLRAVSGSVLFLTGYKQGATFIDRGEAGSITSDLDNIAEDTNLEVNHHDGGNGGGGNGGWQGATIALAVILSLLILALIVAFVLYKRGFSMGSITKRLTKIGSSSDKLANTDNTSNSDRSVEHAAVEVKPERTSRNNNGLFNLQSVTIQTNNPRGSAAVGGTQKQTNLMREMSTELEKKLETRDRQEHIRAKPPNVANKPMSNVDVRKGKAPVAPAKGGIKFNEGVEVVEVENKNRDSVRSSDSESSGHSSIIGQHEDITRI